MSSDGEERLRRLLVAGTMKGHPTVTAIARALGVHRTTLHGWAKAGDPHAPPGSLMEKAFKARFGPDGPLTAARIAEALNCPEEALHPGGPVPSWGQRAAAPEPGGMGELRSALGLEDDADPQQIAEAVRAMRADVAEAVALAQPMQDALDAALYDLDRWAAAGKAVVMAYDRELAHELKAAVATIRKLMKEMER